jgi:hypothetical protein
MAIFKKLFNPSVVPFKRTVTTRDLLRKEAQVGGKLFGPVPNGGGRQFFCLDEHSYVWHEEWTDRRGEKQSMTTRYEIRPNGVLKAQGNQPYHYVEPEEERNLHKAIALYYEHVMREVYGQHVVHQNSVIV